ncbi:MAG: M48 family metalloprotease [Desulfobacterales bacterium]|jgi:predicted Zn-dependent protease|nr:M48 family metalloprotease [Desulfobacterales bacterium]
MNTDAIIHGEASGLTRRDFIRITALSTVGFLSGCAVNPVTGKSQLMLVSEDTEIQVDRTNSPHQFSSDYGVLQDSGLNTYIQEVGKRLAAGTHRPHMPYRFQGVNATYINAYAFPGGSIAATRGILLSLNNEAELSALLGHELGHVNARHTAQQMSKTMMAQVVVGGVGMVASTRGYGQLASQLGMLGAGALLASYSRDNEREADALGMEYMVKTGYGSDGFIGLMSMLNGLSHGKQGSAADLLFATHPMSDERYQAAVDRAGETYAAAKNKPLYKERYMDNTAKLRVIKGAITAMQSGEEAMMKKTYHEAEGRFQTALKQAPNDYAGLVMMAKCQLAQNKNDSAIRYAEKAKAVYPQEAQSNHLAGFAKIRTKQFDAALADFDAYDKKLPGNPNTLFFRGYALEGMGRREASATEYKRFLTAVNQGAQAQHAYKRLVEWGYVQPSSSTAK